MWIFTGSVTYACDKCGHSDSVPFSDFSCEDAGGSERSMGTEHLHDLTYEFDCPDCASEISLNFQVSEYPLNFLSFTIDNSKGAQTDGEPSIGYLREIYSARDLFYLHESAAELTQALKHDNNLIQEISPREFEEIVAEIFKRKGFAVELTKRTRDGGKDIIAIHTDSLGIKNKYFIECKHHSESNKVSVDVVRALHGVKNTIDGPNKTIIVTTSTFTSEAHKFVNNQIPSSWDLTLVDRDELVRWINED